MPPAASLESESSLHIVLLVKWENYCRIISCSIIVFCVLFCSRSTKTWKKCVGFAYRKVTCLTNDFEQLFEHYSSFWELFKWFQCFARFACISIVRSQVSIVVATATSRSKKRERGAKTYRFIYHFYLFEYFIRQIVDRNEMFSSWPFAVQQN